MIGFGLQNDNDGDGSFAFSSFFMYEKLNICEDYEMNRWRKKLWAGLTRQQEIEDDGKLLSIFFINGPYTSLEYWVSNE